MIAGSGIPETDRRSDDRVDFFSNVTLMAVTDLMAGAGADVSRDGIYVLTSHDLPDGSLVDVTFPLGDGGETFRAVGEIQWRQRQPVGDDLRWGLGIEFAYATPEDRSALERFIDERPEHENLGTFDGPDFAGRAPGSADERRESRRLPVSSDVQLKTVAHLTRAAAVDLSTSGMKVVANREFDVGGLVDLQIDTEDLEGELGLLGQVKWREPQPFGDSEEYAHGIEFIDPRADEQSGVEQLVAHRRSSGSSRLTSRRPTAPVF